MRVHAAHPGLASYAVTACIFAIVIALRFRRMRRMRSLKPGGLWVVPAVYFIVAAMMFVSVPPSASVAMASVAGFACGAAVGWMRGKLTLIEVDPVSHAVSQKASPAAMVFLVVLIAVRDGGRAVEAQGGSVSPAMLTDPLVAFALGMFSFSALELYLRAKRLVEETKGAG